MLSNLLRRPLAVLLVLVALLISSMPHLRSAASGSVAHAATLQLVSNPGFGNELSGWQSSSSVEHVTSPTHTGSGAARLNGEAGNTVLEQTSIAVPADATSVVPSFWYRFEPTNSMKNLRFHILQADTGEILHRGNVLCACTLEASEWREYNDSLQAEDIAQKLRGKTVAVRFTWDGTQAPDSVLVDDVALLVETPTFDPAAVVADGSFEEGTASESWTAGSTNYDTPICDPSCLSSQDDNGAHTGQHWAWFGGADAHEDSFVSQTVTIPAGTAILNFWLRIPAASGTGNDLLRVLIDGMEVFRVTDASYVEYSAYVLVSMDISAYADGGSHLLHFESMVFDTSRSGSSFFVDDVAIEASVAASAGRVYLPLVAKPSPVLYRQLD